MDYLKILKNAFNIVLHNKFLWFLGIFLGSGGYSGYMNMFGYMPGGGDNQKFKEDGNIASIAGAQVRDMGKVLGDKVDFYSTDTIWLISIGIIILLLIILLIYLFITARGAITWSVIKLDQEKKYSLGEAWKAGHKYFWRYLSFSLFMAVAMIVVIAVLISPIVVLGIFELIVPAIIFGIIFGLALIAFFVYTGLVLPYAERILFLENKKAIPAIRGGISLFNKNWPNLVLMYLILAGIGIGVTLGLFLIFFFSGLIAFGLSLLIYLLNHITAYIFGGLCLLIILLALIIIGGILRSFNWAVITLSYKAVSDLTSNRS